MPPLLACNYPPQADHAQLYDILISTLTDFVVFLMDKDGCIVSWNPGVERILGYSEREWLGQSAAIIFTPEDRAQGGPQQEISKAMKDGQSPDVRWHVRRDGGRLFVEGTLVALHDDAGHLLGFSKVMRDITEREKRELQLQDALAYAESIVDTLREPLLVLDNELRIRSANRAFFRTFRLTKEETENKWLYALGNGEWNLPQLHTLFEELVPKQTAIENFEVELNFPDLGRKVMLLNARRLSREGNDTELTLLAIEDITDRKRAEQALADTEKQLRLIIDAAPAIIAYIDRDLRYRFVNDAYERWFGVAPADVVGRSVSELFDPSLFAAIEPQLHKVLAGKSVAFEQDYPGARHEPRTVQVTYTPDLDDKGHVQGFVVLGSDTTERKKVEGALRKSEERWRSLFERMAEGFFVGEIISDSTGRASDFRLLEVNPAFEKLTGLAEAAGNTIRGAIPGIQDELIQTYAHVVSTGEPAHFEIHMPALGNRWYEVRARSLDVGRFAVLFLDITERKNNEVRLSENQRQQTALVALGDQLRDLKDISSITSAAMEIVGTTLGVARAGYGEMDTTEEYVTVYNDWTNGIITSLCGTYRFKDFGEDLLHRLGRGESVVIPDVASDPSTATESERWKALDVRAVVNLPLIENGRLVAFLFIQDSVPRAWTEADLSFMHKVADRTWAAAERAHALQELRESEEFTRSVLASSPDCVNVLDLDGRLLRMNEGGCRQMEIDDPALCPNQSWPDFWGHTKEVAEQAITRAKGGYTTRFEGSYPANRTEKWWEVVVAPIHDSSGKPVRILSLSRDISERQRAEQERERLTRELTRSNEELSQFAHIVAHDLQSPLRGVKCFAQLLQREAELKLGAREREFLTQIIESAQRMEELVRALLRFAQVGKGNIEKKPVAMDLLLDVALQSLRVQIEEQEATITRGVLPVVTGDSVQLVQLLQNLVSNALKYRRPTEAPDITIRATEERAQYLFAITDNGEGIAPEHLHRIFEPLERLHGADVPGTGLGLAMCQRIVNRHAGQLWVESQPGVGSTFYFTLPSA